MTGFDYARPTKPAAILNVLFVGLLAGVSAADKVEAQTASQITPHSYEPLPDQTPRFTTGSAEAPLSVPDGAETISLRVASIKAEGGFRSLDAATRRILDRFVGQRITVAQIFMAARALEAAYSQKGYPLVRVIVPAQVLKDGANVRLVVINGFIERVDTESLPVRVRRRIAEFLDPLINRRGLRYRDLERQLLLAAETPGVSLRSTIASGDIPDSSLIVLDGSQDPFIAPLSFDNSLAPSIGLVNLGVGSDLNSLLGLGELIYLRGSGDPTTGRNGYFDQHPRERALAGGLQVPVGVNGWTANVEFVESTTTPIPKPQALSVTSLFDRYSLRVRYPLILSHAFTVNGEAAFDVQRDDLYTLAPTPTGLSLDRLRILRLAIDGSWISSSGSSLSGRAMGSLGIDGLGARSAADASQQLPLSRLGTNAGFEKVEGEFAYHWPLPSHLMMDLTARGQFSFNQPMANAEQIGIVSPQGLSGFDAGTFEGDAGYVARDELGYRWATGDGRAQLGFIPYMFGAYGRVSEAKPTVLEDRDTDAGSYGIGVHITLPANTASGYQGLTVEWARQARDDIKSNTSRVLIFANVQI